MSFPNIPDIDPKVNLTLEDAVSLLLASIALEEISVSKLMDAETDKILCVVQGCGSGSCLPQDALAVNRSVDATIKDLIKFQMLLQFKLENVSGLLPDASTSSTTTTSTSTTTSTTWTCSTTTQNPCGCCLTGRGSGCVANSRDPFCGQTAALYAFVFSCDRTNRTVCYTVGSDCARLKFRAGGRRIKISCPGTAGEPLVLYGQGHAEKRARCKPDAAGTADFILTVRTRAGGGLEFRMELKSAQNPALNHDSGFVPVKCGDATLRAAVCCGADAGPEPEDA